MPTVRSDQVDCPGGCILAIVGSLDFAYGRAGESGQDEAWSIINDVFERHRPRLFVSGGAMGIDSMAEAEADARDIQKKIHKPKVKRFHGKGGYRERDIWIAEDCEHLARIAASTTKTWGSGFTAEHAISLGKQVEWHTVQIRKERHGGDIHGAAASQIPLFGGDG